MNGQFTRIGGYAGLVGACAMFAGDMLFYGHLGTGGDALTSSLQIVRQSAPQRLVMGGLTSIIGGFGYALGAFHIYGQMSVRPAWLRLCVAGAFLLIAIISTATHAVWGSFALTVLAGSSGAALVANYMAAYFLIGAIIGMPASLLLAVAIFRRLTNWPMWFAGISPGGLYFLLSNATYLPAPLGAPIVGGAFNLAFAMFFVTSIAISRLRSRS